MHSSNYSHEARRAGQDGNGFNGCDRYQDCRGNSFNGNANYRTGPFAGRFPAPFRGQTPRFRFGSWRGGGPFRGGGPPSFRCPPPFQGRPPPSFDPRGRPPYSFRPRRFPSRPPYFQRECYRGHHGEFGSSPCNVNCSDSAQPKRCASPQVGSPKQASQSEPKNNIVRKDKDCAHFEPSASAAGTKKELPETCRKSVAGKPKHLLPTPSERLANGNRSPPKRIDERDSTNVDKVRVNRDLSSRQRACASRIISSGGSATKIQRGSSASVEGRDMQCPSKTRTSVSCSQPRTKALSPTSVKSKAGSSIKLKSVVHVPTKKTSSQIKDGKHTTSDTKAARRPTSSNTLSSTAPNNEEVLKSSIGSTTLKSSLHDQRCDKRKSKIQLHAISGTKHRPHNLVGARVRSASPDSTTPPSPKKFCQGGAGEITSSDTTVSSPSQEVKTQTGKANHVLPKSATENAISSATADDVSSKGTGEDAPGNSLHSSASPCSGSDSTHQNDVPDVVKGASSVLGDETNAGTETRINTPCAPQEFTIGTTGDFMVNPLASFLDRREEGIAAVQRWLAVNIDGSKTSDCVLEYPTNFCRYGAYAAQELHNVNRNTTSAPEIPKQDIVPSQMPVMPETPLPALLQTTTQSKIPAPLCPTAKIDSDQETASFASTESDDDCVILRCENLTSQYQGYQQFNTIANLRPSTYPLTPGRSLTQATVSTQAGFGISVEDVVFQLDSYTRLCVLEICGDETAKQQVHALYLKGMRSDSKSTYTKEMQKIASAAVQKRRAKWKRSTGVLRKLAKVKWTLPEIGCVPRISELYELEKKNIS